MPVIFWSGNLSFPMKLMVNSSNMVAWLSGNARDIIAMKKRVKLGYEGACSPHVTRYDALGMSHYGKCAYELLNDVVVKDKEIIDVGCGTGILSMIALERGAKKVICGDCSQYMLSQCRDKVRRAGYGPEKVEFCQLDAEAIPYSDHSFDLAISGMVLGMIPQQNKMISEMVRVIRPGGAVAISTHGPDHYREAVDASFRAAPKRYLFGYRLEFWPLREDTIQKYFHRTNLTVIKIRRLTWLDNFETGAEAYDFFSSTSSSWWFAKFPADKIVPVSKMVSDFFDRNQVRGITADVIFAYAQKLRA